MGHFSRDQIKPKAIHPREKRPNRKLQSTFDDFDTASTTGGSGPGKEVCGRAINRLKDEYRDYNEVMQFSNDDPSVTYFDKSFKFPESIHWEDLPALQWNLDHDVQNIEWKRIKSVFADEQYSMWGSKGLSPADAIQGELGNCWLVTAAMSTAEKPERVYDIFDIQTKNSAGIYSTKMWLLGMPVSVVIDDHLPLQEWNNSYTRYAQVSKDGALWGTILEKAFAKYLGMYEAIDAGHGAHGVEAMTGSPYFSMTHLQLIEEGR